MNLLAIRESNADHVLKKRFIRETLKEEMKSIDDEQKRIMSQRGFQTANFFSGRSFKVDDFSAEIVVLKKHRFVDMKTRETKKGKIKKKSHPIYNRVVFGHLPNIVRRLSFGYTDAVIQQMKELEK